MLKKALFLFLILVGVGSALLFYYIDNLNQKYDVTLDFPPKHPNLLKETALILDMGASGIELTPLYKDGKNQDAPPQFMSQSFFDMDNDNYAELISWPDGVDGFIVYDRNQNGKIDDQSELFGKDMKHTNGFIKLAQLDSNKDSIISAADEHYNKLQIWIDTNKDGFSKETELHTLKDQHIEKINLSPTRLKSTMNAGNVVKFEGTYTANGQSHIIQDIQLKKENMVTIYTDWADVNLNPQALFLPTLKGYGNLPDLHIAISKDPLLLNEVISLSKLLLNESIKDPKKIESAFLSIMYRWAECSDVKKSARGPYVDAQKLIFMEKMTGSRYAEEAGLAYSDPRRPPEGVSVEKAFQTMFVLQMSFFINQVIADKIYDEKPSYNLIAGEMSNGHISSDGAKYLENLAKRIPQEDRRNFWQFTIKIILAAKQRNALQKDEKDALNSAIANTLATENLASIIASLAV